MDLNQKLLEEVKKFKMMSFYQPGKILDEQKTFLIERKNPPGTANVYYNGDENKFGGKIVGYVDISTYYFYPNKKGKKLFGLQDDSYKINGKDQRFNQIWDFYTKDEYISFDYELQSQVEEKLEGLKRAEEIMTYVKGADWNSGTTGSIILFGYRTQAPAAHNILGPSNGFYRDVYYNLIYGFLPGYDGKFDDIPDKPKGVPSAITIFDVYNVNGVRKSFCDNMVNVNLNIKENNDELNFLVRKISAYINSPDDDQGKSALSKLTNMTVMGQADSAAPGWQPGKPCYPSTLMIDHNYGGMPQKSKSERTETEHRQMNLYLATMRARNYAKLLVDGVKKATGKDITITELPAKEYYNEEGKRGPEWRSVVFRPNAPEHSWTDISKIDPKNIDDEIIKDFEAIENAGYKKGEAFLKTNNYSDPWKYISNSIMSQSNKWYVLATKENLDQLCDYNKNNLYLPKAEIIFSEAKKCELDVETNDGKKYKLFGVQGSRGDMSEIISRDATMSVLACKVGGTPVDRETDYMSFIATDQSTPTDESIDMYDENDQVTINNKTYYGIKRLAFIMVNEVCRKLGARRYKGSPLPLKWPTAEDILELPEFGGKVLVSFKDLEKIQRATEKGKSKLVKKIVDLNREKNVNGQIQDNLGY